MSVEKSAVQNTRRETIRSERVHESALDTVWKSLSIGGDVIIPILEDVEEYVGEISGKNKFLVKRRSSHFHIYVYREKHVCTVDECRNTAKQKFSGNWLCQNHLKSYTARHF